MKGSLIPAVVTAGGRLPEALAARVGTDIKALLKIRGVPLLEIVVSALRESGGVSTIAVVGPESVREIALDAGANLLLPEGASGSDNMIAGLRAIHGEAGKGRAILAASDMYGLSAIAVADAIARAADAEGDILFPVVTRVAYEARFPDSPNIWAPIDGEEYTGGSLTFVKPVAIERNHAIIEAVFEARKSQWAMARLLGMPFFFKFLLRRLTIPEVEDKATQITGSQCRALLNADARLAADIDTVQDWEYAVRRATGESGRDHKRE